MFNPELSKGWLDWTNISQDYPIAIIYEVNKETQPIIHLKDIRSLCTCIEYCNKENYDYDLFTGLTELTEEERNKLTQLTGVYRP